VAGIVEAIRRADADLAPGYMTWTRGDLLDANINRSPTAYLFNPEAERNRYEHDTDKEMFLIKIFNADSSPRGLVNWYAVHGTSMNNTNQYISGDNKGYAEQMMEAEMNAGALPGAGKFVAAFGSSNLGDVSPNTKGPMCIDTGLPCDADTSTCDGRVETCIASGPGRDMVESTQIIGHKQYEMARGLFYDKTYNLVSGPVDFIHQYIDMSNQTVTLQGRRGGTQKVKTCKAAMGFSFAAGTTDGPGAFDFSQSDTTGNAFWDAIRNLIKKPTPELEACHQPKPILLPTGEISFPYAWQPNLVPVQLLRFGDVIIIGMPGELTTMAGRRIREAVAATYADGGETVQVVIAGLSNTYSDYVTTYEEYQKQRYEGASTVYGPHTHQAYLQKFQELAASMMQGTPGGRGTAARHARAANEFRAPRGVRRRPPGSQLRGCDAAAAGYSLPRLHSPGHVYLRPPPEQPHAGPLVPRGSQTAGRRQLDCGGHRRLLGNFLQVDAHQLHTGPLGGDLHVERASRRRGRHLQIQAHGLPQASRLQPPLCRPLGPQLLHRSGRLPEDVSADDRVLRGRVSAVPDRSTLARAEGRQKRLRHC